MTKGMYFRDARMAHILQISVIHHMNKRKDKNHMIISIDAEKYKMQLRKSNTHLRLKTLNSVV